MIKLFTISIIGLITISNAQGITNTLGENTAAEKFIIKNSDSEVGFVVDGKGKVGIWIESPSGYPELHIKNNDANNEVLRLESNNGTVWVIDVSETQLRFSDVNDYNHLVIEKDRGSVFFTGELQTLSSTGEANLVPVAYGSIDSDGSIRSGTGNFECTWLANSDEYYIYFPSMAYSKNYVTIVTPRGTSFGVPITKEYLEALYINFFDISGNNKQSAF